jgi:hypothetical protein
LVRQKQQIVGDPSLQLELFINLKSWTSRFYTHIPLNFNEID